MGRLASWAEKLPLPILVWGLPFLEITHTNEDSDELQLAHMTPGYVFVFITQKHEAFVMLSKMSSSTLFPCPSARMRSSDSQVVSSIAYLFSRHGFHNTLK